MDFLFAWLSLSVVSNPSHCCCIAIQQQFHTGMCAQIVMAGSQSSSFPAEVGVKQGCVLAPIIFNLLLVAITLASHHDLLSSYCVGIEYRLYGGLFNLRRLKAKTKTSSAMIFALQYGVDAAFLRLTVDGLQHSLDVMSEAYLRVGLMINTTKAEILSASSADAQTFSISGNQLKNFENFTYFGSNRSFSRDLTNDIQIRINLASSAFDRLSKRVPGEQNLTIHTKIAVYNAVVINTKLVWLQDMGPIPLSHQAPGVFSHQTSPVNPWTLLVAQSDSFGNYIRSWDSINQIHCNPG